MNFLVTGGAGFIGSHLCERLLQAGHGVWALDDLNPFYDVAIKLREICATFEKALGQPFTFVQGELHHRSGLPAKNCSAASEVRPDHPSGRPRRGSPQPARTCPLPARQRRRHRRIARDCRSSRMAVKKITIASSSSVYGINARVPFTESDPIFTPISPYAASKLACEALGHVYHHVYGMDVVMLRFFTVYGPRQRPDLAIHKFARLIDAGKPIPVFGDGAAARDYTYITDTLDGIMACVQKKFGFEIFNLGESQTVELGYLITLLEKALGKKAIIDRQPAHPGDVPLTFADISIARQRLGYRPRVKVEVGIPRFMEWFSHNDAESYIRG